MNMRALERWGMAKEYWMRGERKKYYEAEPDIWQVIRNVLGGRERREVQIALSVLGKVLNNSIGRNDTFGRKRELAQFYLQRIDDLQSLLQA